MARGVYKRCECVCRCRRKANGPYPLCFDCYKLWHAWSYGELVGDG